MITRFKQQIQIPYSLHDMIVNRIIYKNGSVHLKFEHGFVSTEEPYKQAEGNITIEEVDIDSICVLLLSRSGKYGSFEGMKMPLNEFCKKYNEYYFEIIDEMYGFNQVEYIGYLHLPKVNDVIQMSLSMYFNGEIVYETEE